MNFFDGNFSDIVRQIALSIVPFLFAVTFHEYMHGFAAYKLGDRTAYNAGRLTLNPIAHIDIMGLLCLILTRTIGWAKPVPVDFRVLNHKYGVAIVSIAGPFANLILAIISVIILHLFGYLLEIITIPLNIARPIVMMIYYSIGINVALCVFNLLPILPLDGGRILLNFLPPHMAYKYATTEKYGFFIVLALVFTGVLQYVILPPMNFIYSLIS